MTNESPFQRFIALITFDQESIALEKLITDLQHHIDTTKKTIITLDEELNAAKKHVVHLKHDVEQKEYDIQELQRKEKSKKQQLEVSTNARETQGYYNELQKLQQKQHEVEEVLLTAWQLFETAQADFEKKNKKIEESINALRLDILEKEQAVEQHKKTVQERTAIRVSLEPGLPEEWVERYKAMRTLVNNPVVPVENGSCSACFYQVSQPDMAQLRRNFLLQCKDCFRFLYLPSHNN